MHRPLFGSDQMRTHEDLATARGTKAHMDIEEVGEVREDVGGHDHSGHDKDDEQVGTPHKVWRRSHGVSEAEHASYDQERMRKIMTYGITPGKSVDEIKHQLSTLFKQGMLQGLPKKQRERLQNELKAKANWLRSGAEPVSQKH